MRPAVSWLSWERLMGERSLEGGCQCGAIRYRVSGEPLLAALCHCTMCRRANAAPAVAWAMFREAQVAFLRGRPTTYASSPGAQRGFCAACGTPISFTAEYIPGLIDLTIGSLDHPERIAPTLHYWDSERLPWLHLADDLPRYPEFPPVDDRRDALQSSWPRLAKSHSSGGVRRVMSGSAAKPMPGTWSEAHSSMPSATRRKTSSPRRS